MGWLRGWRPGLRARRQGPARAPPHAHPPPPTGHAHPQGCVLWCLAGGRDRQKQATQNREATLLHLLLSAPSFLPLGCGLSRLGLVRLGASSSPLPPPPSPPGVSSSPSFRAPTNNHRAKATRQPAGLGKRGRTPTHPRNPRQPPCFSSPLAGGPGGGVSGHVVWDAREPRGRVRGPIVSLSAAGFSVGWHTRLGIGWVEASWWALLCCGSLPRPGPVRTKHLITRDKPLLRGCGSVLPSSLPPLAPSAGSGALAPGAGGLWGGTDGPPLSPSPLPPGAGGPGGPAAACSPSPPCPPLPRAPGLSVAS